MKICPKCQHENRNKEHWCEFCGRPIQDVRQLKEVDEDKKEELWNNQEPKDIKSNMISFGKMGFSPTGHW